MDGVYLRSPPASHCRSVCSSTFLLSSTGDKRPHARSQPAIASIIRWELVRVCVCVALFKGQQSIRRARSWRISLAASFYLAVLCASLFLPARRARRCLQPTLDGLPRTLVCSHQSEPCRRTPTRLRRGAQMALQFHQTRVTTLSGCCLCARPVGAPSVARKRAHAMHAHE